MKFVEAQKLVDACIATTKVEHPDLVSKQTAQTEAWDNLYTFAFENFPVPVSAGEYTGGKSVKFPQAGDSPEIDDLFRRAKSMMKEMSQLKEKSDLASYGEVLYPFAVGYYLVLIVRMNLNAEMSKTYPEFNRRYGNLVLNKTEF